ncbi:MAG: ATP synthase subunit C [Candidatus Asgardarchaeia archaeon]
MKLGLWLSIVPASIFLAALALFTGEPTATVHILQEGGAAAEVSFKFIAMALAVSFPAIAAGYAVAKTGVSAVASITEKPELFGKAIIFVGLAEGIAIYGLLIAFLIWIS